MGSAKKDIYLTDEQREIASENHNIIYKVINDMHLDDEEVYGVAAIGLCKAAANYDENKNIAFSTYAYVSILNTLRKEYASQFKKTKVPKDKTLYLDYVYDWNDREISLGDRVASVNSFEDDVIIMEVYRKELEKLSKRDRNVILQLYMGDTYEQVGKKNGISHERVRQIMLEYGKMVGYKKKSRKRAI